MQIWLVSLCFIFTISCASVATKTTYDGIVAVPSSVSYSKCVVRIGTLAETVDGKIKSATDKSMMEYGDLKSMVESNLQFRHICKELSFEPVDLFEFSGAIDGPEVLDAISMKKYKRDIPSFSFYSRYPAGTASFHHPYYLLWSGIHFVSLGLVPIVASTRTNFWIVKHDPYELRGTATEVRNSGLLWFWSPFYFFASSKVGLPMEQYNQFEQRVSFEAFAKGLNPQ